MTTAEMQAQIDAAKAENARLQAENEALKAAKTAKITLKMGEKGGVSVYGLGRFPVTLYPSQWERLFTVAADIAKFCKANEEELTRRGEATKAAKADAAK